jgi:hypothetical protein
VAIRYIFPRSVCCSKNFNYSSSAAPTAGLLSNQAVPVTVEKNLFDAYYNGCCNGTFWPLFHSMPDRAIFSNKYWQVKNVSSGANLKNLLSNLQGLFLLLITEWFI